MKTFIVLSILIIAAFIGFYGYYDVIKPIREMRQTIDKATNECYHNEILGGELKRWQDTDFKDYSEKLDRIDKEVDVIFDYFDLGGSF